MSSVQSPRSPVKRAFHGTTMDGNSILLPVCRGLLWRLVACTVSDQETEWVLQLLRPAASGLGRAEKVFTDQAF